MGMMRAPPGHVSLRAMGMPGGTDELDLARSFLAALHAAAQTGERAPLAAFLCDDVEWAMPQRTLHGVDEVLREPIWWRPREHVELEVVEGEWERLEGGGVASRLRQVYRLKTTGEVAYERTRTVELAFRDGRVSRYELRDAG
jgi:hypothetical protein